MDEEDRSDATTSRLLAALLVLAVLYTLYLARTLIIPIVLAALLALVLMPLVRLLRRLRLPQPVAAGAVFVLLLLALAGGSTRVASPAAQWAERLPLVLQQLELRLHDVKGPLDRLVEAARRARELAQVGGDGETPTVELEEGGIGGLWQHTLSFTVAASVTLVLLFFLLAWGNVLFHKLVHDLPTRRDKREALELGRHLERDLSIYLLTITLINAALGVAMGFAMFAVGLPNPILWGVMAALLNFIPYIGAVAGASLVGLAGVIAFDSLGQALVPPILYILINSLEGYFVTPMVLGRRFTLNPLVILLGLLFWGWLWGVTGALISVPMLVCIRILCEHVPRLRHWGRFLGSDDPPVLV